MPCYAIDGVIPVVDPSAFVHPTAVLIGDVIIGPGCYVGPCACLRGDFGRVVLMAGVNVQDTCVIHGFPKQDTVVEENGHIGHGAVLHSCIVRRDALVGMNAVVMDEAEIGEQAMVAACSFVPAGTRVAARSLVAGIPAKVIRELKDEVVAWKLEGTRAYQALTKRCLDSLGETQPLQKVEADRRRLPAFDVESLIASNRRATAACRQSTKHQAGTRTMTGSTRTGTPMDYQDILYEVRNGAAWITINRPDKMNAFRGTTCDELIKALNRAGYDKAIASIVLAGAGDRAFCTGGDQSSHDGQYDGRGTIGLPMEELHNAIRDVPKPIIARVQGYAIGGGNVLCTVCDFTIASEKAIFGQVGPKMGSVDPGYGTAFLARIVGEKKAREMWYLCRRYSAAEALAMGLVNTVVPHEKLDETVQQWCDEILEKSPTALAIAKRSFNMDTAHQSGIAGMGMYALKMYYDTEESKEGVNALKEKRKPEFRKFAR